MSTTPQIIIIGGPNGAGKSTAASILLPIGVPFLNADDVAKTLPGYPSSEADLQAGRQVLEAMDESEERRQSFATETTLASRSLAQRITRLRGLGYQFLLHFLWTPSPDFSMRRVENRVRLGGHSIPPDTIRRRHAAGLKNLFEIYIPQADLWSVYQNSETAGPQLIARGTTGGSIQIVDEPLWNVIRNGRAS